VGLGISYDATMTLQRSVSITGIKMFVTTSKDYLTTSKGKSDRAAHKVLLLTIIFRSLEHVCMHYNCAIANHIKRIA